MAKYPLHLIKRGGIWYYRRTVPANVALIVGKPQWVITLKTSALRDAEAQRSALDVKHQALIDAARNLSPVGKVAALSGIWPRTVAEGTALYAAFNAANNQILETGDARLAGLAADEQADVESLGGVASYRTAVEQTQRDLAKVSAETLTTPERLRFQTEKQMLAWRESILIKLGVLDAPAIPAETETPDSPRILTALETWLAVRANPPDGSAPLAGSTARKYRRHINQFVELVGDLMVSRVTTDHIKSFADALAVSPNLKSVTRAHAKLTFPQLVELRRNHPDMVPLGRVNENKVLDYLRAFLNGQGRPDLAKAAPTRHIPQRDRDKVRPISPADLRRLFALLAESADADLAMWCHVMAYSGLRPEEAAQLSPSSIVLDSGVHKLVIDDRDGRSLKNDAAHRMIPVHPRLIELGLLEHVKAAGGSRLIFKSFGLEPSEDLALNPSRRLKRLLDLIAPGKSSANRLRHSYVDALRNARIDEPTQHYLTGHTSKHVIHAGYGSGRHLLEMLRDVSAVDPLRDVTL